MNESSWIAVISALIAISVPYLTYRYAFIERTKDIKRKNYGLLYIQIFEISDLIVRYIGNQINIEEKIEILEQKYCELRKSYFEMHLYMTGELIKEFDKLITDIRYIINTRGQKDSDNYYRIMQSLSKFLHEKSDTQLSKLMKKELNIK